MAGDGFQPDFVGDLRDSDRKLRPDQAREFLLHAIAANFAYDEARLVIFRERSITVDHQLAIEILDDFRVRDQRLHRGDDIVERPRAPCFGQIAQTVDSQKQGVVEGLKLVFG